MVRTKSGKYKDAKGNIISIKEWRKLHPEYMLEYNKKYNEKKRQLKKEQKETIEETHSQLNQSNRVQVKEEESDVQLASLDSQPKDYSSADTSIKPRPKIQWESFD